MATHTTRWLECDFPGCVWTFDSDRYAAIRHTHPKVKTLRDAAAATGWMVTDVGEDLCSHHAEIHQERPAQPHLFAVPDSDQTV